MYVFFFALHRPFLSCWDRVTLSFLTMFRNQQKVEEAPAALLLARAAFLSGRKSASRRATLWYFLAASRLEKCGIVSVSFARLACPILTIFLQKPLTMFFLRRAHEQYHVKPEKGLSPSFWGSEDQQTERSDDIAPGIEHSLGECSLHIASCSSWQLCQGRLLYSSGDIGGAVRLFVGLLRGSSHSQPSLALPPLMNGVFPSAEMDKVYVEDFRVAFNVGDASSRWPLILSQAKLYSTSNLFRIMAPT
jgi:hypothetical protein